MIQAEDILPVERKLQSERVNETRHVRTFDREELLELMQAVVLDEAGLSKYETKRQTAKLDLVLDGLPEKVTVKVTVQESRF